MIADQAPEGERAAANSTGARPMKTEISVNRLATALVDRLVREAEMLRIAVTVDAAGTTIIDAGVDTAGGIEAGRRIAEICMGGLGEVRLDTGVHEGWPGWLRVRSSQPVLACMASQYAGWSLAAGKDETGGKRFFALGSGPARALAAKEPLFEELGYRDRAERGVLVLEVDRAPPQVVVDKVLRDCGLAASRLAIVLTPTASLAGTTQVVARVLEVALHRAHELGFALHDIVEGSACAPLPAPGANSLEAMARTNDAILYGGQVRLTVRGDEDAARALAQRALQLARVPAGRVRHDRDAQAGQRGAHGVTAPATGRAAGPCAARPSARCGRSRGG